MMRLDRRVGAVCSYSSPCGKDVECKLGTGLNAKPGQRYGHGGTRLLLSRPGRPRGRFPTPWAVGARPGARRLQRLHRRADRRCVRVSPGTQRPQ